MPTQITNCRKGKAQPARKAASEKALGLSSKQQRFVVEYLKDQNATQAAIRTGLEFGQPTGHYVYLLVDPRGGQVFYVGKGQRGRLRVHARLVRQGLVDNAEKCRRIAAIHEAGLEVQEWVFAADLCESDALRIERGMIAALREHGLTNISWGSCTNVERAAEMVASAKRQLLPVWIWKLIATPAQKDAVARIYGTPEAMRQGLLDELDEALALSK
ncbi:terminase small subunit [Xanthomonas arboricola pv. corylina]|uniref:LEM-3-like GIY-YIG domain-containing protein n=1 Tax=Xanthomonas arboricola TaxID=56448 RepID=UPI0025B0F63D|nr:terminase small subunit [Xanthomonas arboricola]MDN0202799.1 terminase small subunit [Xanthomonas arboricola pv. corylina]MDN0215352.1 terminase small subunit [Xanthomonas arboricola pv. corylina]